MEAVAMRTELELPIADPHEQRVACVLLLDTSGSMDGEPIRQLNAAMQQLKADLAADSLACKRAEIEIITFDSEAKIVQDFARVIDGFNPPILAASGTTSMGAAISLALNDIEYRKEYYRAQGIVYTRPWIFLITDGAPTDRAAFEAAVQRASDARNQKKCLIFGIGVEGADTATLKRVSGDLTFKLNPAFTFAEFFKFVSSSLSSASASKPGDQMSLRPGEILIQV
jgi:uncharacterized protein YegL